MNYNDAHSYEDKLDKMESYVINEGGWKSMYLTECGWHTGTAMTTRDEDIRAFVYLKQGKPVVMIWDGSKTRDEHIITFEGEKFRVNRKSIDKTVLGYFADKSFKRIDIAKYIEVGENTISFDCDFRQSESVYENLKKAWAFESEKNKLSYDMEIEAIYLIGDFSVHTDGKWEKLERNAVRYDGEFVIDKPKTYITLSNIEKQGFPFFCGEMCLEGEVDITGDNPVLILNTKGINVVEIEIDGKVKTILTDNKLSLKGIEKGKHKIKINLKNNLRNLLGPHHLEEGECIHVNPCEFFKEKCIWNMNGMDWNDGYCFVETGI